MKFFKFIFVLFLLSFGTTIVFLQFAAREGSAENQSITIESGMTVRDVADVLKEHGIITSALAFRWYLQFKGLDTGIQPGTIEIPIDASFAQIAELLAAKAGKEVRVTIPEGFTLAQIDALLAEKELAASGALVACARTCDFSTFDFLPPLPVVTEEGSPVGTLLEGMLFPETYFVDSSDFVPKFFLERMLGTFRERVVIGLAKEIAASGHSFHEIMTMASLIERETRTAEERPIVAGILWKRFDAHQGLDVDATLRYGLAKMQEPLTKEDLESTSPYNTRKYVGLPPGPIANAGMESIRAVLAPVETSYWYYLHGKDGTIRYAETNEEHNENRARYL